MMTTTGRSRGRFEFANPFYVCLGLLILGMGSACQKSASESTLSYVRPIEPVAALSGTGTAHLYDFTLQLEPPAPSVGELFSVLTLVRDAHTQEPVEGVRLQLDATMPAHGHGMMTAPEHSELGNGQYRSDGMKFHMPGPWVFEVSTHAPKRDRLEFSFNQPANAVR